MLDAGHAGPFCHTMREVAGLAIYMLGQNKAMVRECGGQTELAMLSNEGHVYYLADELIVEREQKYKSFDRRVMVNLAKAIIQDCTKKNQFHPPNNNPHTHPGLSAPVPRN